MLKQSQNNKKLLFSLRMKGNRMLENMRDKIKNKNLTCNKLNNSNRKMTQILMNFQIKITVKLLSQ